MTLQTGLVTVRGRLLIACERLAMGLEACPRMANLPRLGRLTKTRVAPLRLIAAKGPLPRGRYFGIAPTRGDLGAAGGLVVKQGRAYADV